MTTRQDNPGSGSHTPPHPQHHVLEHLPLGDLRSVRYGGRQCWYVIEYPPPPHTPVAGPFATADLAYRALEVLTLGALCPTAPEHLHLGSLLAPKGTVPPAGSHNLSLAYLLTREEADALDLLEEYQQLSIPPPTTKTLDDLLANTTPAPWD